ncbi:hypothetical protein SKAU_G00069510 [Synaphobranchus kaupii]|uniref:Uncharacterized protein n=1 Tax=Synaphobranchus kaupii TaxID=118154 RepID=A0A9Q1G7E4_SYNKA|nr:hypothetical protein SKAU_G00069510 [Synaphobranchus kaupii]
MRGNKADLRAPGQMGQTPRPTAALLIHLHQTRVWALAVRAARRRASSVSDPVCFRWMACLVYVAAASLLFTPRPPPPLLLLLARFISGGACEPPGALRAQEAGRGAGVRYPPAPPGCRGPPRVKAHLSGGLRGGRAGGRAGRRKVITQQADGSCLASLRESQRATLVHLSRGGRRDDGPAEKERGAREINRAPPLAVQRGGQTADPSHQQSGVLLRNHRRKNRTASFPFMLLLPRLTWRHFRPAIPHLSPVSPGDGDTRS